MMRSRKQKMTAVAPAQGQRGLVLFVALIVLVAMTLAGIGMVRSVDTANLIAGNLAFKQGTIQSADRGIEAAFQWLIPRATGTTLYNTDQAAGYFSVPPVVQPDWYDPSVWANSACINGCAPDPNTGITVRYMIHRLCDCAGTAPEGNCPSGVPNQCMITYDTSGNRVQTTHRIPGIVEDYAPSGDQITKDVENTLSSLGISNKLDRNDWHAA